MNSEITLSAKGEKNKDNLCGLENLEKSGTCTVEILIWNYLRKNKFLVLLTIPSAESG